MKKWTNQQKLLSLCGVLGSGLALGLISIAIKIGPQNAINILSLADEIGPDEAIRLLKKASLKIVKVSDYKNAM